MKYIILFSTLLSFLFYKTDNGFIVRIGKHPDCVGFNICKIIENNNEARKDNETIADISVINDKSVEFSFRKSSISDKAFLKYFSTGFFIIDEDFSVPESICEIIQIPNCIIKEGRYKITSTYDRYVVIF
jgi:hypothetical protein